MEPFAIKSGDLSPTYTVLLADADGALIDLTGLDVQFVMRSLTAPYEVKVDAAASPDPDQSANRGRVTYVWVTADTDTPGDYLAEWVVSGLGRAQTFPSADYNRVRVMPSLDSTVFPRLPLVGLGEIEAAMQRSLTPDEADRAMQLIEQVTGVLELHLNRDLTVKEHVDTVTVPWNGLVVLPHGPLLSVSSVTLGGYTSTAWNDTFAHTYFTPGSTMTVTYTSGDVVPHPAAQAAVCDAVAAAILAGPKVATGALGSYSVEGTSITYGAGAAPGANTGGVGRFPVASIAGVARLRRAVLAW